MIRLQVHPKQLVPGCIVLEPVIGKSDHPIIESNTVIEEHHIKLLKKLWNLYCGSLKQVSDRIRFSTREDRGKAIRKKREKKWLLKDCT